jgi:hypothetical protein
MQCHVLLMVANMQVYTSKKQAKKIVKKALLNQRQREKTKAAKIYKLRAR